MWRMSIEVSNRSSWIIMHVPVLFFLVACCIFLLRLYLSAWKHRSGEFWSTLYPKNKISSSLMCGPTQIERGYNSLRARAIEASISHRRHNGGDLSDIECYCLSAQRGGFHLVMEWRQNGGNRFAPERFCNDHFLLKGFIAQDSKWIKRQKINIAPCYHIAFHSAHCRCTI